MYRTENPLIKYVALSSQGRFTRAEGEGAEMNYWLGEVKPMSAPGRGHRRLPVEDASSAGGFRVAQTCVHRSGGETPHWPRGKQP